MYPPVGVYYLLLSGIFNVCFNACFALCLPFNVEECNAGNFSVQSPTPINPPRHEDNMNTPELVSFPGGLICGSIQGKGYAEIDRIYEGITYLRNLAAPARINPGPRRCDRVSCSWGSAIWLCNDRTDVLVVSWQEVAGFAAYILENCPSHGSTAAGQLV
ncbi:hypothetical protein F4810DRAFT_161286 [Camillea tinctor]|nr:hypothetical protein F4810DRAFT_161286 [Camillea tinctor]